MNKRTISITGQATCSMKPDMCIISFTAYKSNEDYSECLSDLNEEVSKIIGKLKRIKIDKECLTTKDFDIKAHNIYDDELKEYVFVEYRGEHRIDIKIDNNNTLINKILNLLNSNEFTPRISINFGLRDESKIKEEALRMAIEKAKKNAKIITMDLGVKLGNVIDIKYNFEDVNITRRRYDYFEDMHICENNQDFNIMPEDSKYDESVSVVWEID